MHGAGEPVVPVRSLPSGTVTFLFTDIEGSTRLWEQHPEAMGTARARAELDERARQRAWDEGRAMALERTIAYALEEPGAA